MTSFQMPNVFVIPPEEDHSPAWCCFDAARRNLNHLSQVYLDSTALASITANDATISGRGLQDNSILDPIGHHGNLCVEHDINYDCEAEVCFEQEWDYRHQSLHGPLFSAQHHFKEPADDSDVIEVVKVGRCVLEDGELMQMEQNGLPAEIVRSKTLKSRASRVFHTLKKVGKRRSNKLPPLQDNGPASPTPLQVTEAIDAKETPDNSKTRALPRRSSILLSQLFVTPSSGLKSRSSFSYAADDITSLPHTSNYVRTGTSLPCEQNIVHGAGSRFPPRTTSPSPSLLNKRHFSKINLQKLLSFATMTSSSASLASSTISGDLTLSSNDDTVLASPSLTSNSDQGQDGICTEGAGKGLLRDDDVSGCNTDDYAHIKAASPLLRGRDSLTAELSLNLGSDLNLDLGLDLGLPTAIYQLNSSAPEELCYKEGGATKRTSSDINFEMHLDSLHFDDLSFDVSKF